jgi:hypothetical protein
MSLLRIRVLPQHIAGYARKHGDTGKRTADRTGLRKLGLWSDKMSSLEGLNNASCQIWKITPADRGVTSALHSQSEEQTLSRGLLNGSAEFAFRFVRSTRSAEHSKDFSRAPPSAGRTPDLWNGSGQRIGISLPFDGGCLFEGKLGVR